MTQTIPLNKWIENHEKECEKVVPSDTKLYYQSETKFKYGQPKMLIR